MLKQKQVIYLINTNGILTFSDNLDNSLNKFDDYFDIFVGMVSGKESVFKNDCFGNISVLNKKDTLEKYILIENFPTKSKKLDSYLLKHKNELLSRKIRKFTDNNWFEWGALRNYNFYSY